LRAAKIALPYYLEASTDPTVVRSSYFQAGSQVLYPTRRVESELGDSRATI